MIPVVPPLGITFCFCGGGITSGSVPGVVVIAPAQAPVPQPVLQPQLDL